MSNFEQEGTGKAQEGTGKAQEDTGKTQEDTGKLLRLQTTLARYGELALRSDDLDEILTEACRLAGEALGTELAKVVELHEDGRTLTVRAGVGWKPGVVGTATIAAVEDTSEGHALRTGEPMISPDIATETRFRYAPFLIENGVRAVANVLIIGGKGRPPFGILQIDSRTPRAFTESDTAFLRSYANLLAATVDRLRVLQDLRDGEARLRLALETGELGAFELNLHTGSATHSARCDQIFGDRPAAPAWNLASLLNHILPDERAQAADALARAMDTGVEWHLQCRIRRADDGAIRWIETRGRTDGMAGRAPVHVLGIVADVTVRKQAEEALRRSNEALEALVADRTRALTTANANLLAEADERSRVEQALRHAQKMEAVGQLTGGLAHDFNNQLTGISGSIELIRLCAARGRIAEIEPFGAAAMVAVDRAARLIERLLAFSRQQTLDPRPTDVDRLIAGMAELFAQTAGVAIQVRVTSAGAIWPTLCDANQLENALLNLVINGRDAMPDGGTLSIETANTALTGPDADAMQPDPAGIGAGDYVALRVSDTGLGMAADIAARALEPFFTTKPLGQGTGLGLAMVQGFAQLAGGHVELRSAPGQGTTVTLYLPRCPVSLEELAPAVDDAPAMPPPAPVIRPALPPAQDRPAIDVV